MGRYLTDSSMVNIAWLEMPVWQAMCERFGRLCANFLHNA
jgi:hypothetical protein